MKKLETRTNLSALNDQQRKAVLSNSKRLLVLAGAGSGKTNTLLQKINYLIDDELVNANNIIAITFTKNAANEMLDRMILSVDSTGYFKKLLETKGVTPADLFQERKKFITKYPWLNQLTIKTFHSLCYQIMKDDGVHVFDNQFKLVLKNSYEQDKAGNAAEETEWEIIQKVTIKLASDKEYLLKLKRYIIDYFVDKVGESEAKEEYRPEGKFFTTLKGDKVRSKSEQYIADWLFRNSLEYQYEPKLTVGNKSFHPDFFIPSANVYIEHVSNMSHPTFWKEVKMQEIGATCIKTYDKATQNSAVFNSMLNRVIKGRVSDNLESATVLHYDEEFSKFGKEMKKFYRQVLEVKSTLRNSNKSTDEVQHLASQSKHERVRLFYEVAMPIVKAYSVYCENCSYLDFDGLIEYVIKLFKARPDIKERYRDKFKYVLVDEFQDVNNMQVKLLRQLVKDETQLFCVGDDWQSIYGFRGSEIDYIVNFKKHFKNPELITLNLNYRSTDHIVNASTEVIKKNKLQIVKEIKAVKKGGQKVKVHYAEYNGHSESFIWECIERHLSEGINPEDILILYRRSAMSVDVKEALNKSGVKVQFKTIHSAKGLEAKVVFVLGLHASNGGFPDPWMQDKIYQVIKKTDYNLLLEEERRLFYVALTRAKDYLYLISQKGSVSEFIKDIPKDFLQYSESDAKPIDQQLILCSTCNIKLEDHFNFCPECGTEMKEPDKSSRGKMGLDTLEEKIKLIPFSKSENLDDHVLKTRTKHRRAYEPWSEEEDALLETFYTEFSVAELSSAFGRSKGGIKARFEQIQTKGKS